ncbi:MAG: hypothetical protein HYR51_09530 [Candidatus Rokubacteria bacterium]|nr:hypothetical protein [Candidatus Rokubacteria bacterium]
MADVILETHGLTKEFRGVQGAIFAVCVLTFRRGIVGELGRLLRRPL